jgi:hypothetical protein
MDLSGLLANGDYYLQLIVGSGKSRELFNGSIAIAEAPIPGALLLFGTALLGLGGARLRKTRHLVGPGKAMAA